MLMHSVVYNWLVIRCESYINSPAGLYQRLSTHQLENCINTNQSIKSWYLQLDSNNQTFALKVAKLQKEAFSFPVE